MDERIAAVLVEMLDWHKEHPGATIHAPFSFFNALLEKAEQVQSNFASPGPWISGRKFNGILILVNYNIPDDELWMVHGGILDTPMSILRITNIGMEPETS